MATAAVVPSRGAVLHLYAAMLRTSRSFSSYNFRHYFVRRTKDTFRSIQASTAGHFELEKWYSFFSGRRRSSEAEHYVQWCRQGTQCHSEKCYRQPTVWRLEVGCRGREKTRRGERARGHIISFDSYGIWTSIARRRRGEDSTRTHCGCEDRLSTRCWLWVVRSK